jgi:hypothetical protein
MPLPGQNAYDGWAMIGRTAPPHLGSPSALVVI